MTYNINKEGIIDNNAGISPVGLIEWPNRNIIESLDIMVLKNKWIWYWIIDSMLHVMVKILRLVHVFIPLYFTFEWRNVGSGIELMNKWIKIHQWK